MMIKEPGYRLNVGIIIINDKGNLLLCKRKNTNSWQFPQGCINKSETPLQAAKRELFEEVGIESNCVKLLSTTKKWFKYDIPKENRTKEEEYHINELVQDIQALAMDIANDRQPYDKK